MVVLVKILKVKLLPDMGTVMDTVMDTVMAKQLERKKAQKYHSVGALSWTTLSQTSVKWILYFTQNKPNP